MLEVLSFLAALRDVHPDMARWGLHGGCFRVYLMLKQRFPDAQPWYDSNHVLTKISDAFYDIRGEVRPESEVGAQYLPMDPLVFNRTYSWEGMPHAFACPEGFVMIHQDLLADLMDQEPLNDDQQERLQKCVQEVAHG